MNRRFMTAAVGAFVVAGGPVASGVASPAHVTLKRPHPRTSGLHRARHAGLSGHPFIHTSDQVANAFAIRGTSADDARPSALDGIATSPMNRNKE